MTNKDGCCSQYYSPSNGFVHYLTYYSLFWQRKQQRGKAYLHLSLLCLKWAPFCQPIPHSFWTPFKSKMQPKFHHGTQLQNQGNKRVKTLWGKNGANTWKVSRKGEKNILIIFTTSSSSGFANSCTCQPVFLLPFIKKQIINCAMPEYRTSQEKWLLVHNIA